MFWEAKSAPELRLVEAKKRPINAIFDIKQMPRCGDGVFLLVAAGNFHGASFSSAC